VPAPYATLAECKTFYAGTSLADDDLQLTTIRGLASDAVQHGAPAPDPEGADYAGRAKRAELFVGRYFWQTKGFISSQGLSSLSMSFDVKGEAIQRVVSQAMGSYYTGGAARVGYVGYW
jgi:hypothetical protein